MRNIIVNVADEPSAVFPVEPSRAWCHATVLSMAFVSPNVLYSSPSAMLVLNTWLPFSRDVMLEILSPSLIGLGDISPW